MDHNIPAFVSGTHNLIDPENIPKDAAQDSQNFVTMDGRVVLANGRELLGAAGVLGGTTGFHKSYKENGRRFSLLKEAVLSNIGMVQHGKTRLQV